MAAVNATERQLRQLHEIDRHTQRLLVESPEVRREFMKNLDTKSPEAYARTSEVYRNYFYDEVVGRFADQLLPPNVRTRKAYEEEIGEGHVPASYLDYLEMLNDVFAECARVLEPGGRIAVNVANLGRRPYRSDSAPSTG